MKLTISIIIFFVLVSSGCTREIIVERNITIEKPIEIIKTVEIIKKEPCNVSCPVCNASPECPISNYKQTYIQGLIREAKHCEADTYFYNLSDCIDNLNKVNKTLRECVNGYCKYNNSFCNKWNLKLSSTE